MTYATENYLYTELRNLERGDFFTITEKSALNPKETNVWIRGQYDRSEKKYECYKYDDINHTRYFKGEMQVFTDFIF